MAELLSRLIELQKARTPFVEIILVDARGSTPAPVGARALINKNGLFAGTVGGGKVEAKAIAHALAMLETPTGVRSDFLTWNLQRDVGMTCGGEVKLYFERHFNASWKIAVFGAGHVAQELVPLLCRLDCQVYCIDPREEWLAKITDHPSLTKKCLPEPYRAVADLPAETQIVLMTQGHATDFPILREILATRQAPYLGVIGSLSKALVLKRDLADAGIDEEKRNSFFCPVGLPIGNSSPMEIAISITAQLIAHRDKPTP